APHIWRRQWRQWGVMLLLALLLALPLLMTLGQQPEAEGRVAELAVPLVAARQGDFGPLWEHVITTLAMFHNNGDGEWLYNIPQRPIFGVIGALFFWLGVALAVYETMRSVVRAVSGVWRQRSYPPDVSIRADALGSTFLLLWWLAGISPAFISVPPASLGHTIMAQPAVYLLAALPVWKISTHTWGGEKSRRQWLLPVLLAALLVGSIAWRDLPDYFVNWTQRGMVRFLYRADIHEVAAYLNETNALSGNEAQAVDDGSPLTDFGITGLLAGPWDKIALQIDLDEATAVSPRWYNPERALLLQPALSFHGWPNVTEAYADAYLPASVSRGEYQLSQVTRTLNQDESVCFVNGLCWATAVYDPDRGILELGWWVKTPLVLPEMPLISNPPPPGVYSGPRLAVFGQLWDGQDNFLAGDDGLWVDPYTLQPGDQFVQQHRPQLAAGMVAETAVLGLYDPMTGERILTEDGREYVRLPLPISREP
ncbi:MAG: hypothetical protein KC443_16075, partial [Anaerolineales bacterium]|nr:hypothetical protein [Anaerolineales bacterium]